MTANKTFFLSLFLAAMMCVPFTANAQVTIGSAMPPREFSVLELFSHGERGLRLPKMTTEQRNTMRNAFLAGNYYELAIGLVIFNTTSNCLEYWNGTRWVSLCEGNSQKTLDRDLCHDVPADGDGCHYYFRVTDPDCEDGPFSFAIVGGSEFAMLNYMNETDGIFSLSFIENNSIRERSAVVRITSECTGLFRYFLFTQLGQECDPDLGTAPLITASGTSLCVNGAVLLSVPANTPNLHELIWTRNNVEIAGGTSFLVATQPGVYNVSMGFAGCRLREGNAVTITRSEDTAPNPVTIALFGNGGVICGGAANTVTLTALGSPTAQIIWFHNGVATARTGNDLTMTSADAGEWMAILQEGDCFSAPSNTVTVLVDEGSTGQVQLNPADILVNGQPINMITHFCPGSSLILTVNNPQPNVTYQWFNGPTPITSPFNIPEDMTSLLLRLVATDNSNILCPAETNSLEQPITGVAPPAPTISGVLGICSGTTTNLTATAGAFQYEWFLNNISQGLTPNNFFESGVGDVKVRSLVDGCWSAFSPVVTVFGLSAPEISWTQFAINAIAGANHRFSVQTIGTTAPTHFDWAVQPPHAGTITGSGASVLISFTENANVIIEPANACGAGHPIMIENIRVMSGRLPSPIITPTHGAFCNSIVFTITRPEDPENLWTNARWSGFTGGNIFATRDGSAYSGLFSSDGTNHFFTVTASSTSEQPVTINFRGSIGGMDIEPLLAPINVTVRRDGNSTVSMEGINCFGRVHANFNIPHTYTLGGSLDAGHVIQDIVWSYMVDFGTTPFGRAITEFTPLHLNTASLAGNSVSVRFDPEILTPALGAAGINVTIVATVTLSGGACDISTLIATRVVNIRDRSCCGTDGVAFPQRIGANYYLTHYFMTNGVMRCWMVENLRETPPSSTRNPASAAQNHTARQYKTTFPSRQFGERGFYYNHAGAQAACPPGWRLPSQSDFVGLNTTLRGLNVGVAVENDQRNMWHHNSAGVSLNGTFSEFLTLGSWWSSEPLRFPFDTFWQRVGQQALPGWYRWSTANQRAIFISVRCIRDL